MTPNLPPPKSNEKPPLKPSRRKWLKRLLWTTPVVCLLLFTPFWAFWYVTLVAAVSGVESIGEFYTSPWCKPGDFVLNVLQPMVSDERMIEHFEKNKVEMEQMAKLAMYGDVLKATDDQPQAFKRPDTEHVPILKKIKIKTVVASGPWYTNPYELKRVKQLKQCRNAQPNEEAIKLACFSQPQLRTVELTPAFGRTANETACSRMTSKHYRYYPVVPPKIENGKVIGPIEFDETTKALGTIVSDTEWNWNNQKPSMRKINDHWFIERF